MTAETYAIEYECSFDAAIPGAYFAREIGKIYEKEQIGKFERDPNFPVYVAGDLGFTDSCSWWVWQKVSGGFRVIDYYEANGREIQHYIDWIQGLGNVEKVYLPHDARAKSLQTGRSIVEVFLQNGIIPEIVPKMDLQDGIEAARQVIPLCWFDEGPTYEGLEHLRAYCRLWDEKTQAFKDRPNHDSHSHAADAFRYMALSCGAPSVLSVLTLEGTDAKKGAHYAFCLEDLWHSQPAPSRRIG
jgi:phage terminase large subunit